MTIETTRTVTLTERWSLIPADVIAACGVCGCAAQIFNVRCIAGHTYTAFYCDDHSQVVIMPPMRPYPWEGQ